VLIYSAPAVTLTDVVFATTDQGTGRDRSVGDNEDDGRGPVLQLQGGDVVTAASLVGGTYLVVELDGGVDLVVSPSTTLEELRSSGGNVTLQAPQQVLQVLSLTAENATLSAQTIVVLQEVMVVGEQEVDADVVLMGDTQTTLTSGNASPVGTLRTRSLVAAGACIAGPLTNQWTLPANNPLVTCSEPCTGGFYAILAMDPVNDPVNATYNDTGLYLFGYGNTTSLPDGNDDDGFFTTGVVVLLALCIILSVIVIILAAIILSSYTSRRQGYEVIDDAEEPPPPPPKAPATTSQPHYVPLADESD